MKEKLVMLWKILYPILIYLTITVIVQLVITNILAITIAQANNSIDTTTLELMLSEKIIEYSMFMNMCSGIVVIPIMYILYRKDKLYYNIKNESNKYTRYILVAIFGISVCMGFNWLIDISRIIELFPGFNEVANNLYGGNIIYEIVAIVLIAPILEELLFRGIIYNRLKSYSNKMIAMIISALIFALLHGNMVQGIYAFIIGLCLVYVYEKYKSLKYPMIFHAAANMFSVIVSEVTIIYDILNNQIIYTIIGIVSLCVAVLMLVIINKSDSMRASDREEM